MIKAIFFDLWGTLVENGVFPSPTKQIWRLFPKRMAFSNFVAEFENALMTKEYDNLIDGFAQVFKDFGLEENKFLIEKMVGVWNKNSILCNLFPETENVLKKLKKKYKLVLVSNSPTNSETVISKFNLEKYFDEIILSCKEGYLKTDPELYETALKRLKLKPSEVLMVGDSIPTDIEGSKKSGIKSVLIDRRDRRDFKPKILSLIQLEDYLKSLE